MRMLNALGRVLQRLDPRETALCFPRWTVVIFVLLCTVFLYGNMVAEKGGVLDDAILDETNPTLTAEHYVKLRAVEGFYPTESVSFVYRFGHRGTIDNYRQYIASTRELELTFGARVVSLATMPYFRDDGVEVDDTPHLTEEMLTDGMDLQAWEQSVSEDPSVYGVLVSRDFTSATAFLFLEPGYEQTITFRRIVEFVEGKRTSVLGWWLKRSIEPRDPTLGVGGWVMGRGMIDQTLNVDVFTLVAVGLTLMFPLLWNKFGSARLAALATLGIVGTSIFWVRGSIGLLDLCGWPVRERVYVLLAYANCIVQGVSFALHRFEGLRGENGVLQQRLRVSASVDGMIFLTATVAIFGFATLWWFAVLPVRELGMLSALGVAYVLVLTSVFGPSFALLVEREAEVARGVRNASVVHQIAEWLVYVLVRWLKAMSPWWRLVIACGVLVVPCVASSIFLWQGRIVARSKALEYIEGTLVQETAQFLNEPGRSGFEYLDFLVEPTDPYVTIDDPKFLSAVTVWIDRVRSETSVREVLSVLTNVRHVTAVLAMSDPECSAERRAIVERIHVLTPATEAEAREAFFYVENALGSARREQLWYDRGIRVSLSMEMEDSVELGEFIARVQSIAAEFSELRVTPFGKVPVYPEVDRYIREGKPLNAITSQGVIIVIMFLWLVRIGRRGVRVWRIRPFFGACVMSLPFVFAGAILVIVMGWWSIPLDNAVAAITALAINAAIDFSIYLVMAYDEELRTAVCADEAWESALLREGATLILDAGLNMVCFAPLLLSHFTPAQRLGSLMILMLGACAFGALVIMMSVLPYCVRRAKG